MGMQQRRHLSPVLVAATIAAAASVAGLSGVRSEEAALPLDECLDAVGTYLTTNPASDQPGGFASRSLISLTNGGHSFFTDSGQEGGAGFAPFTEGRGAWRCVSHDGNVTRLRATIIDFTLVTADWPTQHIGRLDIDATYDKDAGKLSGTLALSLAPIDADPMNEADLKKIADGPFDGYKITAP
jgi:hypothetical protein